jgi:hypothetical protein
MGTAGFGLGARLIGTIGSSESELADSELMEDIVEDIRVFGKLWSWLGGRTKVKGLEAQQGRSMRLPLYNPKITSESQLPCNCRIIYAAFGVIS